jgi:hypothetical protein
MTLGSQQPCSQEISDVNVTLKQELDKRFSLKKIVFWGQKYLFLNFASIKTLNWGWIQVWYIWYIVATFVNVIMYPHPQNDKKNFKICCVIGAETLNLVIIFL